MKLVFEWDKQKAQSNLTKHYVSFEEAKTVFNDPLLLTYPDELHSEIEERYISIGSSGHSRTLLVVHTEQEAGKEVLIRIISCRKATNMERKFYEETAE
ncbi:BrnT family toxin [Candidatus Electrothrix sp.]|uniref:BrnT family toxin n=1 Tax=Candidatus Electrothrix sp. TaxID=2170559 RepID=UPI00405658E4